MSAGAPVHGCLRGALGAHKERSSGRGPKINSLPFRTTRVEHDGAQWVWWWTEGSPRNVQSGTVGTWRRFKGHILYPL